MAAMSVKEAVQETLFRQFLGGADPSCRLGGAGVEVREGSQRQVEDLDWWRYDRSLAMWYCEWLDTYYDSCDRSFFRRDELTQLLEPADIHELRELAGRMRLELPEHCEPPAAECGTLDPEEAADETTEEARGGLHEELAEEAAPLAEATCTKAAGRGADDGGWHETAARVGDKEEEPDWVSDGHGSFTHWSATTGRLFLWQEQAGVLYEYLRGEVGGGSASSSASGGCRRGAERYRALWAVEGPLCVLSRVDDTQSSRVVDRRGVELGGTPHNKETGWTFVDEGLLSSHARVFPSSTGRWLVEPLAEEAEILVDGRRTGCGRAARLRQGAILRLGASLELMVDLPDWPGAPPPDGVPSAAARGQASSRSPAVLEQPFLPREPETPPTPSLTGAERARALNAALRRAICQPTSREREAVRDLEARYQDQAAKRRRLHPEPSAAEALLLRKAQALAVAHAAEAGGAEFLGSGEAPELPEAADMYSQDIAGTMDAAGRFAGNAAERAGLGYRLPVTGAQRLAAARSSGDGGGVRFLAAERAQ